MSRTHWHEGNRVALLENGEEFYPRVFEMMAQAQREILLETFIFFDDPAGQPLRDAVLEAAGRGVQIQMTVDGWGSETLTQDFLQPMIDAGVRIHIYDPVKRIFGHRTHIFRRLHRKLIVIDQRIAWCGGINFSHDHLRSYGPHSKQDYALELEGPAVADIYREMLRMLPSDEPPRRRPWGWLRRRARQQQQAAMVPTTRVGDALVAFVIRDNGRHRADIERIYRVGIRAAKHRIVIANAYFFPGYRLLRDLRRAARRGVDVRLILQGNPDMQWVQWAANTLHDYLLRAGVHIYEYCERPMHAKVAIIDDDWSTVGSSNLDPLSLFLNLEANLVVHDRGLVRDIDASLTRLMDRHCREIGPEEATRRTMIRQLMSYLAYHISRRLPSLAGWLPAHAPKHATLPSVEADTPP
ncbi:cardiolipin synthase ClsB [Solimonas marina]|uniref:Cardiolipin synthase B n=1 Tax=Solimonas marina TaxID=2714601 RepID=A0A970B6R6_9GAMM|nr:cardiolipin synthase ClsB [Solimonas marina]NKF22880.1 cardiolipin synthase ClsB [Solimonas marina]